MNLLAGNPVNYDTGHFEAVEKVSVLQKYVSEQEVEEDDEQVEEFAKDEPAEIYVVPDII